MRIEIVGGIASGKTTLARAIELTNIHTSYEDFESNPFYQDFYKNPSGFAFQTEITYLLQHYSAIEVAIRSKTERMAFDYSLVLDLVYARVTLDPPDLGVFEAVLDRVIEKIQLPQLIVKLECNPLTELQRIRARARPAEAAIQLSYLTALHDAANGGLLDPRFKGINVLRIDSEHRDFRPNGKDRDQVVDEILRQLKNQEQGRYSRLSLA